MIRSLGSLLLALLIGWSVFAAPPVHAGPVDWQEVEPSGDGRQWWDSGSLRPTRDGHLSVLSRFQPASDSDQPDGRPPQGRLFVMELDCDEDLYRDTAVNGLPRWGAQWQAASEDALSTRVLKAACAASLDRSPTDGQV